MQYGNGDSGEVQGLHANEDNPKCGKKNAGALISHLNGSRLGQALREEAVHGAEYPPNPLPLHPNPLPRTHDAGLTLGSWLGFVEKVGI